MRKMFKKFSTSPKRRGNLILPLPFEKRRNVPLLKEGAKDYFSINSK
jgi:hypothetical protein